MLPRMRRLLHSCRLYSLTQAATSRQKGHKLTTRPDKEVVSALLCSRAQDRSKRADLVPAAERCSRSQRPRLAADSIPGPARPPCRLAEMSQSRSPGGLLAGMAPCVVQALQSVGPAAPAASCTSQHFVTAAWRINVAGRDAARGAQATSSQLCRHRAGLTLSNARLAQVAVGACLYRQLASILVQSRYDDFEDYHSLRGTEYMCLTMCGHAWPCTRTCGTDHRLYSLLGSCGGTEQVDRLPTGSCCIPAPLF